MLARNNEHSTPVLIILEDQHLLQNTDSKQIQRKPVSNLNLKVCSALCLVVTSTSARDQTARRQT